jgi:hypothetical protein
MAYATLAVTPNATLAASGYLQPNATVFEYRITAGYALIATLMFMRLVFRVASLFAKVNR